MKNFFLFLCFVVLISCSSPDSKSTSANDSTSSLNTPQAAAEKDEQTIDEEVLVGEDSMTLDQRYTTWKDSIDSNRDSLLEVSISTQQYEASSTVIWYFESGINPVYYSINWSSEGSEGSTEYIIKDNKVMCAWVENNATSDKWCLSTGGFRTTTNESSGDDRKESLDDSFGNDQTNSLQSELLKLSAFFKEAGEVEVDGDWVTFRLEKVVNYGGEFTEYTEAKVHKKIWEELK